MKLRQIEAFRAVMLAGSATDAAASLAVSQPAVSRLISDLERQLGFDLFDRQKGRALVPTEDAEILFREVERAFVSLDHLMKIGRDIHSLRQRSLRVAAPHFLANGLLCEAASRFLEKYPDVSVSIDAVPQPEVVELISLRQQNLGLAALPIDEPSIRVDKLGEFDVVCIVGETHPFAQSDSVDVTKLGDVPIITGPPETKLNLMIEQMIGGHSDRRRVQIAARTQEIACFMVSKGWGIAVLSEPLPPHIRGFPGIQVKRMLPRRSSEIGILTSNLRPLPRIVKAFQDALYSVQGG